MSGLSRPSAMPIPTAPAGFASLLPIWRGCCSWSRTRLSWRCEVRLRAVPPAGRLARSAGAAEQPQTILQEVTEEAEQTNKREDPFSQNHAFVGSALAREGRGKIARKRASYSNSRTVCVSLRTTAIDWMRPSQFPPFSPIKSPVFEIVPKPPIRRDNNSVPQRIEVRAFKR